MAILNNYKLVFHMIPCSIKIALKAGQFKEDCGQIQKHIIIIGIIEMLFNL
jgi:hypothetical protein